MAEKKGRRPPPAREKRGVRRRLRRLRQEAAQLPPLGLGARIVLGVLGWLLVLLGIVQLVTPGQGILTLLMGLAVLSLVSRTIHRLLYRLLGRWPRVWKRLVAFRKKVHGWFHRPEPPAG
ncbi:MAG: hypothetical protein D6696_19620 [Acidobacteria bacterium]|nr:MAG: hypothetical protein D6696_19620 [Acidobacteriota bacterium]